MEILWKCMHIFSAWLTSWWVWREPEYVPQDTGGNIAKIMKNKSKKHTCWKGFGLQNKPQDVIQSTVTNYSCIFRQPRWKIPPGFSTMLFPRSYILHCLEEITFVNEACKLIYNISCFPVEGTRAPEKPLWEVLIKQRAQFQALRSWIPHMAFQLI